MAHPYETEAMEYLRQIAARMTPEQILDALKETYLNGQQAAAHRCAEIAKKAEQYGACPHCAIADEFGLEDTR